MTRSMIFALLVSALSGCGLETSLDLSEKLIVSMLGTFDAPEGASGTADPKSQRYTLTGVTATPADGSAAVDLFDQEGAEATEYKIVSRSQIIFEADMSDHVDVAFSALTVTFAPTVEGDGPKESDLSFTLTNPAVTHDEPFTVETAKTKRLRIFVQWKDTVVVDDDGDETMIPPTFATELVDE